MQSFLGYGLATRPSLRSRRRAADKSHPPLSLLSQPLVPTPYHGAKAASHLFICAIRIGILHVSDPKHRRR